MLPFRFYLITDRLGARHEPLTLLPRLASGGLRALQVREKDLAPRQLHQYCRELQRALEGYNVRLFLNDSGELASRLNFSGVHLREESRLPADQPEALRKRLSFGVSTHSLAGVLAAEAAGADFATFGPVYPTPSKAAYGEPVGLQALEEAAAASALPLLALGGVTPKRCRECLEAGARGAAAISAVWAANDPMAALGDFADALGGL